MKEVVRLESIRQKLSYLTEYLNNYWTNLRQRFSYGRGMHADYKSDIGFVVA